MKSTKIILTKEMFRKCAPYATQENIDKYYEPLLITMDDYRIDTALRLSCFLANIIHESGSFRYAKEIASGQEYDTGSKAKSLGNTLEKDGDGQKYKGRGPMQITGKTNYKMITDSSIGAKYKIDLVKNPELLEDPLYGMLAAGWYWNFKGLNSYADRWDFKTIVLKINGGLTHYPERVGHWIRCKEVLNVRPLTGLV